MYKDTGFRKVVAFKSIYSRGEITMLLFKNENLYESSAEFLRSQYTLTILHFHNLDKEDENKFDYISDLDQIDEYLD